MKNDVKKEQNQYKYPHKALQTIEDSRSEFYATYKKQSTVKLLITALCLAAILVAFVVVPSIKGIDGGLATGLTVVIAVVALAASYAISIFTKKKNEKKMKEYFNVYFNCVNDYAFDGKAFSNIELQKPGKITVEEFNESTLYKDVVECGSRGLTNFKYKKFDMSIVDCAGNIKDAKRMRPIFVGKMVRTKCSYKGERPIYVYLKGNDRALPPTNTEGILNVLEDKDMVVYSNYSDWKKVLSPRVMKVLTSIKTGKNLVDLAISLNKGKLFIMMGYDDPLMVLPLQHPFDPKPNEKFKKDILTICELVETLNK